MLSAYASGADLHWRCSAGGDAQAKSAGQIVNSVDYFQLSQQALNDVNDSFKLSDRPQQALLRWLTALNVLVSRLRRLQTYRPACCVCGQSRSNLQ